MAFPNAAEKMRDLLAKRSDQSTAEIYSGAGILDAQEL